MSYVPDAVRINTFRPSAPIPPSLFVGRSKELTVLRNTLHQVGAGYPSNFMIIGERGIGKSSLLSYLKAIASPDDRNHTSVGTHAMAEPFLVVHVAIDNKTDQLGLILKVEFALQAALARIEKLAAFVRQAWEFVRRVEVAGTKIGSAEPTMSRDLLIEQFISSLATTAERICEPQREGKPHYRGVILLVDEADAASPELDIGRLLRQVSEGAQMRGCTRLCIGLAGLPELKKVVRDSHPSALRTFPDIPIEPFSDPEARKVIEACLFEANRLNSSPTTISVDAIETILALSQGYPHFLQQFGHSAFEADTDGVISGTDVSDGANGSNGAIAQLGQRYYAEDYYVRVTDDGCRETLRGMAEHLNNWTTKAQIQRSLHDKTVPLEDSLRTLCNLGIIQQKADAIDVYRLGHRAFALWIKLHTRHEKRP